MKKIKVWIYHRVVWFLPTTWLLGYILIAALIYWLIYLVMPHPMPPQEQTAEIFWPESNQIVTRIGDCELKEVANSFPDDPEYYVSERRGNEDYFLELHKPENRLVICAQDNDVSLLEYAPGQIPVWIYYSSTLDLELRRGFFDPVSRVEPFKVDSGTVTVRVTEHMVDGFVTILAIIPILIAAVPWSYAWSRLMVLLARALRTGQADK